MDATWADPRQERRVRDPWTGHLADDCVTIAAPRSSLERQAMRIVIEGLGHIALVADSQSDRARALPADAES